MRTVSTNIAGVLIVLGVSLLFPGCTNPATGTDGTTTATDTSAPGAPTGVIATAGDAQAVVTWSAVPDAGSYKVFYASGSAATSASAQATAAMISGTTATITGLSNGAEYSFVVVASNAAGDSAASAVASATLVYAIGYAGPGGGLICYISATGFSGNGALICHYLEAAPSGWDSIGWDNGSSILIAGAQGTAIGSGMANTAAIIAAQGTGNYAAYKCSNYTGGGLTDWFLPSKDELTAMCANLYKHSPSLGGFYSNYYWSSSQSSQYYAWFQHFTDGKWSNYATDHGAYVRAVRAF